MVSSILLPVDLSDEENWKPALEVAIAQARAHQATLHVVSVLPEMGMAMVGAYLGADFAKGAMGTLTRRLAEWAEANAPADVEVHPHVLQGKVYDEILRAADRLGVDLIVMGSHRPEFSDYLLGPNAARVVRHAKQSVYVVR